MKDRDATFVTRIQFNQGPRLKMLQEMNVGIEPNQAWLNTKKRKAFYTAVASDSFREGVENLLQVSVFRTT